MKNKATQRIKGRRDALAKVGMVAGTAAWSKPVIDVVILPAHATTTDATGAANTSGPCECSGATRVRIKAQFVVSDATTGT